MSASDQARDKVGADVAGGSDDEDATHFASLTRPHPDTGPWRATAEVLLQGDDPGDLAEAEELLSSPDLTQFLLWNSHIFRYYVAQARLALRKGRDSRDWAALALELAGDRRPQLPRHPTVGVIAPDPEVISELRVLAQGW